MINLKFVNIGITVTNENKKFRMNPNFYHLKSYYKFRGKHFNEINWLPRILDPFISVNEILDKIKQENVNILCLSFFIWNHDKNIIIAKKIKQHLPYIKIIAGGPNLWAHRNKEFFDEHPYIDYVVYGDGEEAFVEILDSIIEKRDLNNNYSVNIVTKERIYPFKVFKDIDYQNSSAVLTCQEDIKEDILYFQKKGFEIIFNWERARGCPYKCSFCDWSSGLHHKVNRSQSDWKAEIDFLFSLNVSVTPSDANWGIFKEDVNITEYAVKKGNFYITNLAKLQKDKAFEISKIVFKENAKKLNGHKLLKLSFQDLNENVLNAIDRPDIPWLEHKSYILDFANEFPDLFICGEIMLGLPNQSIESLVAQFYEFDDAKIRVIFSHIWEILPNSPAYDTEYQKKYGIESRKFVVVQKDFKNKEELIKSVTEGDSGWVNANYVIKNNTIDFKDIIFIKLLSQLYNFFKNRNNNFPMHVIENIFFNDLQTETIHIASLILEHNIYGIYNLDSNEWHNLNSYFLNKNNIEKFLNKYQITTNIDTILNMNKN